MILFCLQRCLLASSAVRDALAKKRQVVMFFLDCNVAIL